MSSCEYAFAPLEAPRPSALADDLLADARAEAEGLLARAQAEGFEAGRAEALAGVEPAVRSLVTAAEHLAARADALEVEALELAVAVAEKVVGTALAARPDLVLEAVRGALRGILDRERITVLVHPDDLDLVRGAMDGMAATLGGIEHFEVQAERRVGRGGAVVRTAEGDVDARVEVKLQRAREILEAALA